MSSLPPLRVITMPDPRPAPISSEEAFRPLTPSPYVQDSLALDFSRERPFDRQWTPRRDLPDPAPMVRQLVQAYVEIMAGLRPAAQVARWSAPEVYDVLCRRSVVAARRPKSTQRRPVVRRVRVQEPADGVVEACAVIVEHDRVRALALRMTGIDRRWVVTPLQIG